MSTIKLRAIDKIKRPKVRISVELKKEIIDKYENGVSVSNLSKTYGRSMSTISTILSRKEEFKNADVAKGVTVITKQRPKIIDEIEKLLLIWINDKQILGDRLSETIICEKAKQLHADLSEKFPGITDSDIKSFKASKGWFENFKKRSSFHKFGEDTNSDVNVVDEFIAEFKNFVETEEYLPQHVFNCDESGLFWKRMINLTQVNISPELEIMKDRLTLLLCGNASGDLKIKPLLVYNSETPRVFKQYEIEKSHLNVTWKANNKGWMTKQFFSEWINEEFAPTVSKYLLERGLPHKALLVLRNASTHPPDLEDMLLEHSKFITVKFLPSNTTQLLQPMSQRIIVEFKTLYAEALSNRYFEVTSGTDISVVEFLRDHFHIIDCINLIDRAWLDVSQTTMNSSWKQLWPDCVTEQYFEEFESKPDISVDDEVVTLNKFTTIYLEDAEVDNSEMETESSDLTTEKLIEIHKKQQQKKSQRNSSTVKEEESDVSSSVIREMCELWEKLKRFTKNTHPDKSVVTLAASIFNNNVMSYYRKTLKDRQKQISCDSYLAKETCSESQSRPSGTKRIKREHPKKSEN